MKTKQCFLCRESKPLSEFHNRNRSKDGKQSRCKTCQPILTGRKGLRIVVGQRSGHLTAIMPSDQRGSRKEKQWVFRCDCGQEIIRTVTKVLKGRPISCGCKRATFPRKSDSNFNLAYYQYVRGARARKHFWDLSKDSVRVLFAGDCSYCGAKPAIVIDIEKGDMLVRNGIDRLDSSVGYTLENCVSCCSRCNYFKGTMSHIKFKQAIEEIYTHLFAK